MEGSIRTNGIDVAYETFGAKGDPTVVLVMGLASQMIAWPDEFCRMIAARGYEVVRFDNRDTGLSTHLHQLRVPGPVESFLGLSSPPYRIEDMADDAAGLITGLDIAPVHLVGISMGGFISQCLVLAHPKLVASMTLMMTSTGSKRVGRPNLLALAALARRPVVVDSAGAQAAVLATFSIIGSPGYPIDEAMIRRLAAQSYERSHDASGYQRQVAAVAAQSDRTALLGQVEVPTVVLHGLSDRLVDPSGGRALARAIPRARFVGYPGMGHDLPRALWGDFVEQIVANAARAALLR